MNFILDTDSYKLSHFLGYPKGSEYVYSYAESRGGAYPETVFLGLQRFIRDLAAVRITANDIADADRFAKAHGVPFNFEGWARILFEHEGRIPVRIMAVPEGTLVPTRNVLVTVENTDPELPWLTSYIETALLRAVWYPTTVATRIHYMKESLKPFFYETSDSEDMGFAILDFSARGVTSLDAARIGGLAHLVHFIGSDNIPAVLDAQKYYDEPMAAFSVPATEHSIMTSFGKDHELESFEYLVENMLQENGILSVVSDTWNVYEAAHKWVSLAEKIRAKNGTLVFRPDSGNFREVLPRVMRILMEGFGYTLNSKGYKVLNNVKILQGDGINESTVMEPFQIAKDLRISTDSIMTGSGGGLMQADIDRDTCRFAFKASNIVIDGVEHEIRKEPVTDSDKASKKGRLALINALGGLTTIPEGLLDEDEENELQLVYLNGELYNQQSLAEIRDRAK